MGYQRRVHGGFPSDHSRNTRKMPKNKGKGGKSKRKGKNNGGEGSKRQLILKVEAKSTLRFLVFLETAVFTVLASMALIVSATSVVNSDEESGSTGMTSF